MYKQIILLAILATFFALASCNEPVGTTDTPVVEEEDTTINDQDPMIEEGDSGWYPLTPKYKNSYLYSVFFVSDTVGYIAGEDGLIIKTTNGGLNYTWEEQTSGVTTDLYEICFANENTGFALSTTASVLLRTTDGGSTWQNQPINDSVAIKGMLFVDANTGFAIGNINGDYRTGYIYKTTNAGQTWQQVYTHEGIFLGLSFANENKGIVTSDNYIAQTNDGGNTWDYRYISPKYLGSIFLVNENVGYAVGSGDFHQADVVLKTVDGGQTWNIASDSTTNEHFRKVYFISETEGYAISDRISTIGVYLMKTTDGGQTWTDQFHFEGEINSIYFTDNQIGYLVGGKETPTNIYKTRTGGE